MSEKMEWNMGNENQVNDKLEQSKHKFLPEVVRDIEKQPAMYSLEDEFSKTGKNKNILLYLFIIGFFAAVIAGTLLVGNVIEQENREVVINISEFDDLRLKDLIDSAQKDEGDLEILIRELDDLKLKLQNVILDLKDRYYSKRESVYSMNLSREESDKKIAELKEEEEKKIKSVTARYNKRIKKKSREVAVLRNRLAKNDKSYKEGIKKTGAVLSNYNRLHSIRSKSSKRAHNNKMRTQKRYYDKYVGSLVLKYNPIFKSIKINSIVNSEIDPALRRKPNLKDYNTVLNSEGIFNKNRFDNLRGNISSHYTLMNRMLRIPYKNSVPPSLKQLDFLTKSIVVNYEGLWSSLAEAVKNKNKQIDNFNYAFDSILKEKPESGYIIDPRDKKNIIVYVKKMHRIKSGRIAFIFRDDDEYIGKIKFFMKKDSIRAMIIETARDKKVKPFDKILMKMNQG